VAWQLLQSLVHFSHTYCIQICALLVPLNMLATLATMILVGLEYPVHQVRQVVYVAIALAMAMILHVLSWLLVGVVMLPTYILFSLAAVCLAINLLALCYRPSLHWGLFKVVDYFRIALTVATNASVEAASTEAKS